MSSATLRQGELTCSNSDNSIQTLGPAAIKTIDPLHIGINPAMLQYLTSFPQGNDPAQSLDNGLNFNRLRFNAPLDLDQSAYVAKMDFNIDQARKHTLSIRGTLNDASQDLDWGSISRPIARSGTFVRQQQGSASNYTWILKPNLINQATFGVTRLGLNESGTTGTALSFAGVTSPENYNAAFHPDHAANLQLRWRQHRPGPRASTPSRAASISASFATLTQTMRIRFRLIPSIGILWEA